MPQARILIVEDEGLIAADIEDRLTRLGYQVDGWASTGEEAIKNIDACLPDLILMDIMLRGNLDGIAVAEHVHHHYQIPVIFLTAYSDETMIERAKRAEPFAFLLKPFNERELRSNIEMTLYKHRMEQERNQLQAKLAEAQQQLKVLSGLLPICSFCKKIRDDQGYWSQLEEYITDHSEAQFTHSLCPGCVRIHYPQYSDE